MTDAAPKPPRPVELDPSALRALAHPLRVKLLSEIARVGRSRTTDLAAAIGEPPNKTSYHLRQLFEHGIIAHAEPPAGAPDGRETWWRLASEGGVTWDFTDPAVAAIAHDLQRMSGELMAQTEARAYEVNRDKRFHMLGTEFNVPLTKAEADAFWERLTALTEELFALRRARLGTDFPAEVEYDLDLRFLPIWAADAAPATTPTA